MELIILSFYYFFLWTSDNSIEQVAFNYFVTDVLIENYPNAKKVYFAGQTEEEENMRGPFWECFENDEEYINFFASANSRISRKINIDVSKYNNIKAVKKLDKNPLSFNIYRAVRWSEVAFVYIRVNLKAGEDHYLIKVSISEQKVLDVCLAQSMM